MMTALLLGLGMSFTFFLWMAVFDYWPTVKKWWNER